MQLAYVRDGNTEIYIWEDPVSFVRVPDTGEYIWLEEGAYLVQAVNHKWNDNGEPVIVVDVVRPQP